MFRASKLGFRSICMALLVLALSGVISCASIAGQPGPAQESPAREKAEYHYKLATGFVYEKRPIAALKEVEVALGLDPSHAKAHFLKGFLFMGRRNYAEAEVHFHRSMTLNPRLFEARNALAGTYIALKRWGDALEVLDPLLTDPLNPTPWLAHNNAGWAHHKLGQTRQSIYHLRMSVMLKPEFCLGYYNLGQVLKAGKRYEQARRQFELARKQCPKHAPTLLQLGDVYLATSNTVKARDVFKDCVKIAGDSIVGDRCASRKRALP